MTDPHIHLRKLFVGAMLLLWFIGEIRLGPVSVGQASCLSDGLEARPTKTYPPPLRLAYTADELKDRMRKIPTPSAVPAGEKTGIRRSLGAVRGGTGDYLTANCPDLRLTLVQLLRKVNALKKREHSMFSGLSDAEKEELAEANEKLTALMTVLKARCSAPDSD
jgi:hypothetical protein